MGRFDKIAITEVDRQKLNEILDEIDKLDKAKRRYSIQELQSMSILDDRRRAENQRILEELNDFLNASTNFSSLEKSGRGDARNTYEQYLEKRNVSDDVSIDVSSLSQKVYTLADLSFKVNKYTKWLCTDAIDIIAPKGGNFRRNTVDVLKGIYRRTKSEDGTRINLDGKLDDIASERSAISGYDEESIKADLKNLYDELEPIWDLEEMLYEIKNQLNFQLLRCLIKDNYREFKNWGFSQDNHNNWVLNFDPTNVAERYAFHMPPSKRNMPKSEQLTKILSRGLIGRVVRQRILGYRNTITKDVRKNNIDRINRRAIISFFRSRKSAIISSLRRPDIDLRLYTIAKFMPKSAFDEIEREHPELRRKCEELRKLISPTDLTDLEVEQSELTETTEYQDRIRKQIEDTLKRTKKIYVQKRRKFR